MSVNLIEDKGTWFMDVYRTNKRTNRKVRVRKIFYNQREAMKQEREVITALENGTWMEECHFSQSFHQGFS